MYSRSMKIAAVFCFCSAVFWTWAGIGVQRAQAQQDGAATPENMNTFQGRSLAPLFKTGEHQDFRDRPLYYAFYENPGEHNAPRHDGLRTDRYTLSYLWTSDEWMLFDMKKDPMQMKNVIDDPAYKSTVEQLKKRYNELRKAYKVPENCPGGKGTPIPKFDASW